MTARYLSADGPAMASGQPCDCGQPCPCTTRDRDCDDGCLTRPHFYCGMVLTDDQLNDLAAWVRHRSALHRYVEGWGVIRGLAVTCDPGNPRGVLVGPGYARSCCGDDIVTCEELRVDVCGCEPKGPCCDSGASGAAGAVKRPAERAIDLYLRYAETLADPAKVRASCGCGGPNSVQYARIAEGGTIVCVPVADLSTDPATLAAREWDRGYLACAAVVHDYLREVSEQASAEDALKWLLTWIDRAGPADAAALCCTRRHLCRDGLGEAGASGALLEIVLALRARYLQDSYGQCRCPEGVRLGRVWLRDDDGNCAVECVDATTPFRRELTAPGWPQLPGYRNVADLTGQRRMVAADRAGQLGVTVARWEQYRAASVSDLADLFTGDSAYVPVAATCEAQLYQDRCGRWTDEQDGRVLRLREVAG
jgi:hypothetical protein